MAAATFPAVSNSTLGALFHVLLLNQLYTLAIYVLRTRHTHISAHRRLFVSTPLIDAPTNTTCAISTHTCFSCAQRGKKNSQTRQPSLEFAPTTHAHTHNDCSTRTSSRRNIFTHLLHELKKIAGKILSSSLLPIKTAATVKNHATPAQKQREEHMRSVLLQPTKIIFNFHSPECAAR